MDREWGELAGTIDILPTTLRVPTF